MAFTPGPNVSALPKSDAQAKVIPLLVKANTERWTYRKLARESGASVQAATLALKAYEADLRGEEPAEPTGNQRKTGQKTQGKGKTAILDQSSRVSGESANNREKERGDIRALIESIEDPVRRLEARTLFLAIVATEDAGVPGAKTVSEYDKLWLGLRRSLDMKDKSQSQAQTVLKLSVQAPGSGAPKLAKAREITPAIGE